MKTLAGRLINDYILSRFNLRVVRVSSCGEIQGPDEQPVAPVKPAPNQVPVVSGQDAEPPLYPPALRQEHVNGAQLFADRHELIKSLSRLQNLRVAEVGVAYGDFSRFLIDQLRPKCFHAYDIFRFHEAPLIWGAPPAEVLKGLTHREFYEQRFEREIANRQVAVFEGDSAASLNERADGFYDVIYIDADHHYESVLRDATAAINKLKQGGLLIFNDYILYDHIAHTPYGIVHVVNDLCVNQGWNITHFAFHQHMFCDVAIRRAG